MVDGDDADEEQEHAGRSWRDFSYFILLLAMIPLIKSTLSPDHGTIFDQIAQNMRAHPELKDKFESLTDSAELNDFINVFPSHRLDVRCSRSIHPCTGSSPPPRRRCSSRC